MGNVAVVTGAGSGIGRAAARELDAAGYAVIGMGRNRDSLEATSADCKDFTPMPADLADPNERARVASEVAHRSIGVVIHNAGRLEPVGDLAIVDLDQWRQAVAINLEAPLFLTQALIPTLSEDARILHISSGAAHRPVRGWGSYCIGKAGAHMVYRLLADELAEREIAVGSLRPGVVDTPMQSHIRDLPPEQFPEVERFRALKQEGALVAPGDVAYFARRLLELPDPMHFSSKEWDIRQHWDEVV
jgi:NAD(P)-dependent dehydrogenase (short-subunit alcohol dehydrogenase family)